MQDLYRRTLAASWSRQPSELPADECIEDIFSGGNGWKTKTKRDNSASANDTEGDDSGEADYNNGTLRPGDFRRLAIHRHRRNRSASSDKSVSTVTGGHHRNLSGSNSPRKHGHAHHGRSESRDEDHGRSSRSGSIASLAPTLGSSSGNEHSGRGEGSYKHSREIDEMDVRDDLVAWQLPGSGLVT